VSHCSSYRNVAYHSVLGDTQGPNASMRVLELLEQCRVVLLEVLMYDDLDPVFVSFCHLDRSPAEDRYARDAVVNEHLMEHAGANEAGGTCEDEVHHREAVTDTGKIDTNSASRIVIEHDPPLSRTKGVEVKVSGDGN
jgi:hypothetical protein